MESIYIPRSVRNPVSNVPVTLRISCRNMRDALSTAKNMVEIIQGSAGFSERIVETLRKRFLSGSSDPFPASGAWSSSRVYLTVSASLV